MSYVAPMDAHLSHALVLCPAAIGRVQHDVHSKLHRASNMISLSLRHGNALVPHVNVAAAISHHASLV